MYSFKKENINPNIFLILIQPVHSGNICLKDGKTDKGESLEKANNKSLIDSTNVFNLGSSSVNLEPK